jgi:hypothetical protein
VRHYHTQLFHGHTRPLHESFPKDRHFRVIEIVFATIGVVIVKHFCQQKPEYGRNAS